MTDVFSIKTFIMSWKVLKKAGTARRRALPAIITIWSRRTLSF